MHLFQNIVRMFLLKRLCNLFKTSVIVNFCIKLKRSVIHRAGFQSKWAYGAANANKRKHECDGYPNRRLKRYVKFKAKRFNMRYQQFTKQRPANEIPGLLPV